VDSATARNVDAPPSNGADTTTPLNNQLSNNGKPITNLNTDTILELTPAEAARIREDKAAAKNAELTAANAALTAALNVQLAVHHQRPNHLNTVSVGNGTAIFHKIHPKSIPPLPLNPSIGSAVAFLRAAGKLASNGDFTMAIQAIAAHAQELAIDTIANAANSVTVAG
jgi:hypothetical protein